MDDEFKKQLDKALGKGVSLKLKEVSDSEWSGPCKFEITDIIMQDGVSDLIEDLLNQGKDINYRDKHNFGWTALHYAVGNGDIEKVKFLISKGSDLNIQDEMGETPLHISTGDVENGICRLLIMKGADTEIKDQNGFTAETRLAEYTPQLDSELENPSKFYQGIQKIVDTIKQAKLDRNKSVGAVSKKNMGIKF